MYFFSVFFAGSLLGAARLKWEWLSNQSSQWNGICWFCVREGSSFQSLWSFWWGENCFYIHK